MYKYVTTKQLMASCLCFLLSLPLLSSEQSSTTTASLPILLQQAKVATVQKDFKYIVELLAPYESQFGGIANFDYYLGISYLELKRYSDAIFALERSAATSPKFAGAKFELARAHFHNKDYPEAKRLFAKVLNMTPPQKLIDAIATYSRAISAKEYLYTTVHRPSISFNSGYDSNANSATDLQTIQGITLSEKNQQTSSSFYAINLSDYYSKPIFPDWRWQSKGSVYIRNNPSADFVDMQLFIVKTGIAWTQENNSFEFDIGLMQSTVEGEPLSFNSLVAVLNEDYQTENLDRSGHFLLSRYSFKTNNVSTLSISAQIAKYTHEKILQARDITQYVVDLSYETMVFSNAQFSTDIIIAKDNTDDSLSPFANNRYGLKLGLTMPLTTSLLSQISIQHHQIDYEGIFFGNSREDTQASFHWSLNWLVSEKLSYWGKLVWLQNHSTDVANLYSFKKSSIEFGVIYQF